MPARTQKRNKTASTPLPRAQRGSLVALKDHPEGASELAIVVSNDIQNEASDYLLVVPLQRRASRLKAPFAVDLGRSEGMRDLHSARCDWITRVPTSQVERIERARVSINVLEQLDPAIKVALQVN